MHDTRPADAPGTRGLAPDRLAPSRPVEVLATERVEPSTGRLTLRPLLASDRGAFLDVVRRSRDHILPWVPLHRPGETDDAYFERQLQACADGDRTGACWRRVGVLEGGEIVGVFNLNAISRGLDWGADVSVWVGAEHAGRGLALEGARALIDHAFAALPRGLGLHRLHGGIDPRNHASRRLAERLGFAHDPAQRSHIMVGDAWRVHEFYTRTAA